MKEEQFLNTISKVLDDSSLLGDDCAYLSDFKMYATCDNLIEDVHFDLKTTSAISLGYKSVAVNLSDLASNLSTPKYILLGLSLPNCVSEDFLKNFYRGVNDICNKYNVKVAGGDITSASKICISVCALGMKNKIQASRKNKINAGDFVCTTGEFGSSILGFKILNNDNYRNSYSSEERDYFINKHIKPEPRIYEMNQILKDVKSETIAMMDTSDGLGDALYKLATINNVCLDIDFDKIRFHCSLKKDKNYKDYILWGGEDYELLFIINKNDYLKLDKNLFHKIGIVKENINNIPVVIHSQNNTCDIINDEIYKRKVFNHFEDK